MVNKISLVHADYFMSTSGCKTQVLSKDLFCIDLDMSQSYLAFVLGLVSVLAIDLAKYGLGLTQRVLKKNNAQVVHSFLMHKI